MCLRPLVHLGEPERASFLAEFLRLLVYLPQFDLIIRFAMSTYQLVQSLHAVNGRWPNGLIEELAFLSANDGLTPAK